MFIKSAHLEYYSHPLIRMNFHRRLDHDAGRPLQCYHHVVPGGKLNGCLSINILVSFAYLLHPNLNTKCVAGAREGEETFWTKSMLVIKTKLNPCFVRLSAEFNPIFRGLLPCTVLYTFWTCFVPTHLFCKK